MILTKDDTNDGHSSFIIEPIVAFQLGLFVDTSNFGGLSKSLLVQNQR